MRLTKMQVIQGERLPPWYYGHSYMDWYTDSCYYHIIPFNFLVRLFRAFAWKWNHHRSNLSRSEYEARELFQKLSMRNNAIIQSLRPPYSAFDNYLHKVELQFTNEFHQLKKKNDKWLYDEITMRLNQKLIESLFQKTRVESFKNKWIEVGEKVGYRLGYYILTPEELHKLMEKR